MGFPFQDSQKRKFLSVSTIIWVCGLFIAVQSSLLPRRGDTQHDLQPRESGNDTVAPSPPWVNATVLQDPPPCVSDSIPCKFTPTRIEDCSAIKCITSFDGACMERAKRVNLSCLCRTLSSQNCPVCTSPIERAGYYHWLNLTCGVLPEWEGLPNNWTSAFLSLDLVAIGNGSQTCDASKAASFWAGNNLPICIKAACSPYEQQWRASMHNGKDTAWANFNIGRPDNNLPSDKECGLYLSRADVCGSLQQTAKETCPKTMCSTRLERTQYLLWLNKTCSTAASFKGMPLNWEADIKAGVTSPEYDHGNDLTFPECANQGSCGESLAVWRKSASDDFCSLNQDGQSCYANETRLSYAQLCPQLSYPLTGTCSGYCTHSADRPKLLEFLNKTCSGISQWSGLPSNWVDLLQLQLSEVKPWPEVADYHGDGSDNIAPVCPTAEANIAVFAGANLAMLLFTPILGRRKVVGWITFGRLGEPHSRSWIYMGPAMALLQLLANTANALIIKSVPGYSHVDTKTLVMLWTTRPRMAWLSILLVPYQADDVMYFSCAATSLVVELILQLISSYTFGTVANHARWEGLYNTDAASRLTSAPAFGLAAQRMYGGALLWLLLIIVCIFTLGSSVLGVVKVMDTLIGSASLNIRREKRRLRRVIALRDKLPPIVLDKRARKSNSSSPIPKSLPVPDTEPVQASYPDQVFVEQMSARTMLTDEESLKISCDNMVKSLEDMVQWLGQDLVERDALAKMLSGPPFYGGGWPAVPPKETWFTPRFTRMFKGKHDWGRVPTTAEELQAAVLRRNTLEADLIATANRNIDIASSHRYTAPNGSGALWRDVQRHRAAIHRSWNTNMNRLYGFRAYDENKKEMRHVILIVFIGMVGCWISQWVFWVGFLKLYSGQGYCPPRLGTLALNWILFSVVGVFMGSSV
ncbi:hypothetical protein B0H63DRAFT_1203 [Podospora didyma]|uniref:Uncharacterized protein n=1 Tax=Podospora didyma TaxID=330526 RepID=A0AAE0P3I0_9PEZI|nr:hypothetical protein B0H63DRAFT_1203 [Podospora didyma]